MERIKIGLVSLGSTKYPLDFSQLEGWKSKVFKINHNASVGQLPDAAGAHWDYTDSQLLGVIQPDNLSDFTLGLINAPLEDNYYLRRLTSRIAVLSLFEMADIVRYSDLKIENFVLRAAYEMAVLFSANGGLIPENHVNWAHDEVRGCLFDMNSSKADIVFSLDRPILCSECRTRVLAEQVPPALLPAIDRELRKIEKERFYRISDWVRGHPILALIVAGVSSVALNVAASIIFEKAKRILPWLG